MFEEKYLYVLGKQILYFKDYQFCYAQCRNSICVQVSGINTASWVDVNTKMFHFTPIKIKEIYLEYICTYITKSATVFEGSQDQ